MRGMKKEVLLFVAGAVSCGGVLTLIQGGSLVGEGEGLEPRRGKSVRVVERTSSGSQVTRSHDGQRPEREDGGSSDLMERISLLGESVDGEMNRLALGRLAAEIGGMPWADVDALLLEFEKLGESDGVMDDVLESLSETAVLRLFELDGFAALEVFFEARYPNFDEMYGGYVSVNAMAVWSAENPDGVRDWIMDVFEKMEGGEGPSGVDLFLDDEEVVEAFFLNYERLRPGQSEGLANQVGDEDVADVLRKLSLKAQIKLSDDPSVVVNSLDAALGIDVSEAQEVLEEAMAKDLEVSKEWVEGLGESEHRNRALLDVGQELMNGEDAEGGMSWLLNQAVTDAETRKERLELVSRQLLTIVITESRIEMPVFSSRKVATTPEVTDFEGFINYGAPLKPPLHSEQFVSELRERAFVNFEGRFVEQVEAEIQALGLGLGE